MADRSRTEDPRALQHRAHARQGRDGRRVRGHRPEAQSPGRDQDHPQEPPRSGHRQGLLDAVLARGAGRRAAQPSAHRAGVRLRRGRRHRLPRHGVHPRQGAEELLRRERALRHQGSGAHHVRAARRARLRAQRRHHPPRHQAGERDARRAGAHQAHRLRRRARAGHRPHAGRAHAGRHHGRHAGLHVARADHRRQRSTSAATCSPPASSCTSS